VQIVFTGGFKQLEGFAADIERAPDALKVVSEQLAEATLELIREGFELERDPYGKKWARHSRLTRKLRPGGRVLADKGGMKAAWHRKSAARDAFEVANAKSYTIFHQEGTGAHGPSGQPIKPVRAKALRIPAGNGAVFLSQVAGVKKRRMVPTNGRIPKSWQARYVETAQEVLAEIFR
jgi:hypothetical protein